MCLLLDDEVVELVLEEMEEMGFLEELEVLLEVPILLLQSHSE